MSKILDAMRKAAPEFFELAPTIDGLDLYPAPRDHQMREFEQLANSLINARGVGDDNAGRAVVFASTYSGEGSSYVSFNCARCLARLLKRKVAWIDANFHSPQRKLSGLDLNFRDLLIEPESLPQVSDNDEPVLIGSGFGRGLTMDLLGGPNYGRLIERLNDVFRFSIIDAAPIMEGVEVAHLARHAMGLVLVVESQRLKYEVIQHGIDKLRSQNVKILGTVLNKRTFQLPGFLYRRI